MTEPTTPTGKRLALREVSHPHGVRELDLCGLCVALAIEAEARQQGCPDPADHALAEAVRRHKDAIVNCVRACSEDQREPQRYRDWYAEALAAINAALDADR